MRRVLDVARIQLTNWPRMVVYPLALMASLAVLGLVIDLSNGGAADQVFLLQTIYLVVAGAHLQTITQVFPFAVGLSVTRRDFFAATALVVTGYAVVFGVVQLGFLGIERASGGWGRQVRIFDLDYLRQGNLLAQWLAYTIPFLAVSAAAVLLGVVFQRWQQPGVYVLATGVVALLAGIGVLVSALGRWPEIGRFFARQPPLALNAGYPLAIALILGAVAWLAIRRATP